MENNALQVNGTVESWRELPRFVDMEDACDAFRVDDSGSVPLCATYPHDDLGQWIQLGVVKCFTYATIDAPDRSECRVLHPNGEELALHTIRFLE